MLGIVVSVDKDGNLYFIGNTLDDLTQAIFRELLSNGQAVVLTRGKTLELIGVALELSNPRARFSISETRGKIFQCSWRIMMVLVWKQFRNFMAYYLSEYKDLSDNPDDIDPKIYGAYGPRIFIVRD
jgi:thymidylate synthase